MANYDGDVQLTVNLTPGDVIKSAEKISKDIDKVWSKASGRKLSPKTNSLLTTIDKLNTGLTMSLGKMKELENVKIPTKAFEDLQKQMEAASSAMDAGYQKLAEQRAEVEKMESSMRIPTKAYQTVQIEVNKLAHKLEVLGHQQKSFIEGGGDLASKPFQNLQTEIGQVTIALQHANEKKKELEESGQAFTIDKTLLPKYTEMTEALQAQEEAVKELGNEYGNLYAQQLELEDSGQAYILGTETEAYYKAAASASHFTNSLKSVLARLMAIGEIDIRALPEKALNALTDAAKRAAVALKDAAINLAKLAGTGIKNKIKELAKSMLGFNKQSKNTNDVLKGGFRMFLRYGLGIRSVYFLFRRLRKALTEGIENLAQYSGEFNTSMSAMKSSLTRLKNSFATAFAPLIEQVAPILVYVANLISEVVTRIGMLIATLTGKNSFTRAKAVTEDYAKSLNNSSSAADKNKDSVDKLTESWEEYKKTLAGFDDVEILQDMNKDDKDGNGSGSGSGSGSGGSGGYTGPTPAEMFEEVPIAEGLKDLAERIKEAWRNADFTDLGALVGEKLKDALENIPWDTIKATLNKIAKSIATFLNGFLETPGLFTVIGETIAEALNTAFGAVNTFATNFHWDSLGKAIADGINGFFKKFDFKLAAETISNIALGLLRTFIAAVENVEWQTVGEKIQEFLKNVKWAEILEKVGEAAGALVGAIAGFVAGLFKGVPEAIKKWWEENALDDEGEFVIEGFFNGIIKAMANIGTWLYKHLVQPFIDGFREAFGIGSPSKVMAAEGPNIIDGLKQGLEDNIDKLLDWFKELPARLLKKIGDIVVTVTAKITDVVNNIKSKVLDFKANITDKVNSIKSKILDFKANITDKTNSIKDKLLDFKANITDKTNSIKDKVLTGFTAGLATASDFIDKSKKTVSGLIAKLTDKSDAIDKDNKFISGFKAGVTKVDAAIKDNKDKIIKGLIGGVSSLKNSISKDSKKTLSGIIGKITNLKDGLNSKKRTINVTGKVNKLYLSKKVAEQAKSKKGFIHEKGAVLNHGHWQSLPQFASGGIIKGIQRFASGGLPGYGSLFVAGEKGPEIVGNINGRTEILNKSQIASAIYSAVLRGMNTAVNSFGTFISAQLAESTNANLVAIQAGVLAIQNIADQNLIPAITSGRVVPYSMLANTEKQTTTLEEIKELLKNNQNSLTYNEIYSIIEDVVRKYMNIQFYIGDEQVARHANAGNAKIERRLNPVVR